MGGGLFFPKGVSKLTPFLGKGVRGKALA